MALPVASKEYQFNVNQAVPATSSLSQHQNLLFKIKQSLVGFSESPWTVVYSCADVAGSTSDEGSSSADKWSSPSSIKWRTTETGRTRSWIVLKNNHITDNFQLLIDCDNDFTGIAPERYVRIIVSPSCGFSGGTTIARPTATDEVVLGGPGVEHTSCTWASDQIEPGNVWLHVVHSTDGSVTRLAVYRNGDIVTYAHFAKVKAPVAGWDDPWTAVWVSADPDHGDDVATLRMLNGDTFTKSIINGTLAEIYLTCDGFAGQCGPSAVTAPNDITGEWAIYPIGIASATYPVRGRHGLIYDTYWGSTTDHTITYPSDGSRKWVQWGDLVVPWNGTPMSAG